MLFLKKPERVDRQGEQGVFFLGTGLYGSVSYSWCLHWLPSGCCSRIAGQQTDKSKQESKNNHVTTGKNRPDFSLINGNYLAAPKVAIAGQTAVKQSNR